MISRSLASRCELESCERHQLTEKGCIRPSMYEAPATQREAVVPPMLYAGNEKC